MNGERVIELLKIRKECTRRSVSGECGQNCDACDLVQDGEELYDMYSMAIQMISEKRPRVLTIREVKKLRPKSVVWEEYFDGRKAAKTLNPMIVTDERMIADSVGEIPIDNSMYDTFEAGQRRRFWSGRPTNQQRLNTPWR